MKYVGMTDISACGGIISSDLLKIVEYAANNHFYGFKCRSFNNIHEAYWYFCHELETMRWNEGQVAHPIPPMEVFINDGEYVDYQQMSHLPNWGIRRNRYFAVITAGGALGLASEIDGLAGMLIEMNGMPVIIKEFVQIDLAQQWLLKQVGITLTSMGAYIQILTPIAIPVVNQMLPPLEIRALPDIPQLNDSLNFYYGHNNYIINEGANNG